MHSKQRRLMFTMLMLIGAMGSYYWAPSAQARAPGVEFRSERGFCKKQLDGEMFERTELFFGLSKPDGGVVSEADFQGFVDNRVTPRFPDGLTLLTGGGQFKTEQGNIIKEGSKVLILLYPFSKQNSEAIEAIREDYKTQFQQQSVLRFDEQSCVSF
jgi:Protein of unknown function (DUF3574)